mgnify:CR=1 FL=1
MSKKHDSAEKIILRKKYAELSEDEKKATFESSSENGYTEKKKKKIDWIHHQIKNDEPAVSEGNYVKPKLMHLMHLKRNRQKNVKNSFEELFLSLFSRHYLPFKIAGVAIILLFSFFLSTHKNLYYNITPADSVNIVQDSFLQSEKDSVYYFIDIKN